MIDARSDRVEFSRDVLGVEPFDHQEAPLRSDAAVVVVVGGRRSCKTTTAQVWALHVCFTRRGAQVLVTGPNEANVRERLRETAALLAGSPLAREAVLDESGLRITFRNGSALVGVSPTAANIRGRGRDVFGVWVDEPGHTAESVWRDLRYVLLDHRDDGAQAWLTGSPWGDGFFRRAWQLGLEGDPDYAAFGPWTAAMNPRNPRDWIERERARLNELEAAAELDGVWSEDGLQFFPRSLLDRATADVELPGLLSVGPAARGILGTDYGLVYDRSAAVGLFRAPVSALNPDGGFRPTFVAVPHVWEQGAELRRVVGELAGCRSPFRFVGTETNGVGAMPSEELRRRVTGARPRMRTSWAMIATTAPLKLAAYSLTRWLLERGQLVLPREPALLRQLAGLRLDQSPTGARIGAEDPAVHDDVADALAFCSLPFRSRRGRIVCGLSELADPARAVPDAELPGAGDAPAVETGAGLRLPREPALQSVAGGELTLPQSLQEHPDFDRQSARSEMTQIPETTGGKHGLETLWTPGPLGDYPNVPRLADGSHDPVRFPKGIRPHRPPPSRRGRTGARRDVRPVVVDVTLRQPDGSEIP